MSVTEQLGKKNVCIPLSQKEHLLLIIKNSADGYAFLEKGIWVGEERKLHSFIFSRTRKMNTE